MMIISGDMTSSAVSITHDFFNVKSNLKSINDLNSLIFATRANDVTMY